MIGDMLGAGRAILLGRLLVIVPWLGLAIMPFDATTATLVLVAVLSAAQFIYELSMGIEDANDTGFRQSVAPDEIQGRMNSTIRTINRVVYFFGALLAGALATYLGDDLTLGIGAAIFAATMSSTRPRRSDRTAVAWVCTFER